MKKKDRACLLAATNMLTNSNNRLGNDIVNANRELAEKLESISNAEIKSKDRVDISLEEYENMKAEISSLSCEVYELRNILKRIDVPLDKKIVPDSIKTCWCEDAVNHRHIFNVRFAVNDIDLMS